MIPQKSNNYKVCIKFFTRRIALHIKISKRALWLLACATVTGVAAGFINGFLGAGSGVLLMYMTAFFNMNKGKDASRDNYATVVACVLPLSVVSVVIYTVKGAADGALVGRFALPAIIGGVLGALLTEKLDPKVLRIAFAVVVIIAGINML